MIRILLCALLFAPVAAAQIPAQTPSQIPAQTPAQIPAPPATTPQPPAAACGALMGGASADVSVGGESARRLGDQTCLRVIDHSQNVFINGRPALRVGDRVQCPDGRVGIIVGGASSVKINGLPAATAASHIQGCD